MDDKISLQYKLHIFPYIDERKKISQLKIDTEALSYVTRRRDSEKITRIIEFHLCKAGIAPHHAIVTDATACVGGNTLSFGYKFGKINAIEINDKYFKYLKHNVSVYNFKNIELFHGNALDFLPQLKQDVVFLDPPWGGKSYKTYEKLQLIMSGVALETICNSLLSSDAIFKAPTIIVVKLPKNYNLWEFYRTVSCDNIFYYNLGKMDILVIVNDSKSKSIGDKKK
jgi:tRNA G37 N-methylase Trm5